MLFFNLIFSFSSMNLVLLQITLIDVSNVFFSKYNSPPYFMWTMKNKRRKECIMRGT